MAEEKAEAKEPVPSSPVERVREAAKWLIGAFAAIGGLLIAGVQLSDAGQLAIEDDEGRLAVALFGLIFGVGGVIWAILENVRILLPTAMTFGRLEADPELVKYFTDNPELIPGPAKTIAALKGEYEERVKAYETAVADLDKAESDPHKAALKQADKQLARAERDLQDVFGLANWKAIEKLFKDVRFNIVVATVLAAAGIAFFAWAANPPEEEKESGEKPVLGTAPNLGRLIFKPEAEPQLRQALGGRCEIGKVQVLVIGGTKKEPEVVSIPRAGCDAVRFVGGPELAEVVPIR